MAGEALAAADVDPDALLAFVDELRSAGYNVGTDQFIAAQDLLLALGARRTRFADPGRLGRLLGPLLCSSPREQDDFAVRFRAWVARGTATVGPRPPNLGEEARAFKRELEVVERGRRLWWWAAGILLLAAGLLLAFWSLRAGDPAGPILEPRPPAPVPERTAPSPWVSAAAGALAAATLAGWWLWRRRRAQLFLKRHATTAKPRLERITLRSLERELFPRAGVLRIARDFRRRVEVPSDDLDVRATVEKTVRGGGAFTPVFASRLVAPEYLVLVDRAAHGDQQARIVNELVALLVDDGVYAARYHFDGDPRICLPTENTPVATVDEGGAERAGSAVGQERVATLRELALRHPAHRLLLFSDARSLFSAFTGEWEPWADYLDAWPSRAVLTPEPPAQWGEREYRLAQRLPLLPATMDGLAQSMRHGHIFVTPPEGSRAPMPAELLERPLRWTARDAPDPERVEAVLAEVRRYLGEAGFYWLAASAVYPALDWNLTLNLGHTLHGRDGERLLHPERLTALTRLPWFRHGSMPDWLRLRLIATLTPERESEVRAALQALLLTAVESGGGFHLQVALEHPGALATLARPVLRRLSRRADEGPLRDYVFLRFMSGRRPEPLAVRIPHALRTVFQPQSAPPESAAVETNPEQHRREQRLVWLAALVYPICESVNLYSVLRSAELPRSLGEVLALGTQVLTATAAAPFAFLITPIAAAAWVIGQAWQHTRLKVVGGAGTAFFFLVFLIGALVGQSFTSEEFKPENAPRLWGTSLLAGAVALPLLAYATRRYRPSQCVTDSPPLAQRLPLLVFLSLLLLLGTASVQRYLPTFVTFWNVLMFLALWNFLACCCAAVASSYVSRTWSSASAAVTPLLGIAILLIWEKDIHPVIGVISFLTGVMYPALVWLYLRWRGHKWKRGHRQGRLFAPDGYPLYTSDAAWSYRSRPIERGRGERF